eukprot:SAG31_NODE_1621_length_7724_cov_3.297049_3_plen_666_part_00
MVRLLVQFEADVDDAVIVGNCKFHHSGSVRGGGSCVTGLALAAENGHAQVVKTLLQAGATASKRTESTVRMAASGEDFGAANSRPSQTRGRRKRPTVGSPDFDLLSCFDDDDLPGTAREETALVLAARNGHYPVVQVLRSFGVTAGYRMALAVSASRGHYRVVESLLHEDSFPLGCSREAAASVVLAFAAHHGRLRLPPRVAGDSVGSSAADSTPGASGSAVSSATMSIFSLCKDSIGRRNAKNQTPLAILAAVGNTEGVSTLLHAGAGADQLSAVPGLKKHDGRRSTGGKAPRSNAAYVPSEFELRIKAWHKRCDEQVLKADGARKREYTPVVLAAKNGCDGVVDTLLNAGASPCPMALLFAVIYNRQSTVKLLMGFDLLLHAAGIVVDARMDVYCTDIGGCTPLHWAAALGHTDLVVELIRHGSPIDARCHLSTEEQMSAWKAEFSSAILHSDGIRLPPGECLSAGWTPLMAAVAAALRLYSIAPPFDPAYFNPGHCFEGAGRLVYGAGRTNARAVLTELLARGANPSIVSDATIAGPVLSAQADVLLPDVLPKGKCWSTMSQVEQAAATALGFEQTTWDREEGQRERQRDALVLRQHVGQQYAMGSWDTRTSELEPRDHHSAHQGFFDPKTKPGQTDPARCRRWRGQRDRDRMTERETDRER